MKRLMPVAFAAMLFLAGCDGGDGGDPLVRGPGPSENCDASALFGGGCETAPTCGIGEVLSEDGTGCVPADDDGDDGGGAPKSGGALSLTKSGFFTKGVECGKAVKAKVTAVGGSGDLTWQTADLPGWATAVPSGLRNTTLNVTGAMPYDICDEAQSDVTVTTCDAADVCKDIKVALKTVIPAVGIRTSLENVTVALGGKVELDLEGKGGSGAYEWRVASQTLKGISISDDGSLVVNVDRPGIHKVQVDVVDKALAARQPELEKRYGKEKSGVGSKAFTITVIEGGFVVRGVVLNGEGRSVAYIDSKNPPPSIAVPFGGSFRVWVEGKQDGSQYTMAIPDSANVKFEKGVKSGSSQQVVVSNNETSKLVLNNAGQLVADLHIKGLVVTATNAAGESEKLSVGDITFQADPCSSFRFAIANPTTTIKMDWSVQINMAVVGGKEPFSWSAASIDDAVGLDITSLLNGAKDRAISEKYQIEKKLRAIDMGRVATYRITVTDSCQQQQTATSTLTVKTPTVTIATLSKLNFQMLLNYVDNTTDEKDECNQKNYDDKSDCSFLQVQFHNKEGKQMGQLVYLLRECARDGSNNKAACEDPREVEWSSAYGKNPFTDLGSITMRAHGGGVYDIHLDISQIVLTVPAGKDASWTAVYDDRDLEHFPGRDKDLCDDSTCNVSFSAEWVKDYGFGSFDDVWALETQE